jgi:hypothetical protein
VGIVAPSTPSRTGPSTPCDPAHPRIRRRTLYRPSPHATPRHGAAAARHRSVKEEATKCWFFRLKNPRCGPRLLTSLDGHTFAAGFGTFLICYSAYSLLRPQVGVCRGGRVAELIAGLAGGITGGATAFPGAIPTIWCNLRGKTRLEQRGVVQPFILFMQLATLAYFSKFGVLASATWTSYLWCLPAVIAGTWLGLKLFDRIDEAKFRRLVLLYLLFSGVTLMA